MCVIYPKMFLFCLLYILMGFAHLEYACSKELVWNTSQHALLSKQSCTPIHQIQNCYCKSNPFILHSQVLVCLFLALTRLNYPVQINWIQLMLLHNNVLSLILNEQYLHCVYGNQHCLLEITYRCNKIKLIKRIRQNQDSKRFNFWNFE